MITNREDFLMQVLDCGVLDLKLIDDVNYEWAEILEYGGDTSYQLNWLMRKVFEYGFSKIEEAVNDRICELEAIPNERELEPDEEQELAELRELEPSEDFESFHNFIDTHVWCEKHKDIYRKYMQEALDDFADGTGFEITLD